MKRDVSSTHESGHPFGGPSPLPVHTRARIDHSQPILGREGVSLEQALKELMDADDDEILADACKAILRMAQGLPLVDLDLDLEPGSDADSDDGEIGHVVAQRMVDLLLEHGQTELLRLLLRIRPDPMCRPKIAFASLRPLMVLGEIGAEWQTSLGVIRLSSALPFNVLQNLKPFLAAASSLQLTLDLEPFQDFAAAEVLVGAVRGCQRLKSLTLLVPASPALVVLQALVGVKADRLVLNVLVDDHTPRHDVGTALTTIAYACDCLSLDIADCALADTPALAPAFAPALAGNFAALYQQQCRLFVEGLLSVRPHWAHVTVSARGLDSLPWNPVRIDCLEVRGRGILDCTPTVVTQLFFLQVETFRSRLMIDLEQLVASVTIPVWVESVEAPFGVWNGHDAGAAITAIENNDAILRTRDLGGLEVVEYEGYSKLVNAERLQLNTTSDMKLRVRQLRRRPLGHPD